MRNATIADLPEIVDFIYDQFSPLEHFIFLSEDLTDSETVLRKFVQAEVSLFLRYGELKVCGDPIHGLISSIPSKKFTLFHQMIYSLPSRKLLKEISKDDRKRLLAQNKFIAEIHSPIAWHKKHSKNSHYISMIAVAKEARGTGVLRKMLTTVIDECQKENKDIVLETMTEANVPIYQHFGFELIEYQTSTNVPFAEYCFIKRPN